MTSRPRRQSARSSAAVKRRAVGEIFATSPTRCNRRWLFARDPFIPLNLQEKSWGTRCQSTTSSLSEHQQELLIAAGSLDRRRNHSQTRQAEAGAELLDLSDDAALRRRRPDDAATGDFPPACLELRLDEDDGGGARRQKRHDGREHEPNRDERKIHGGERDRLRHLPA